MSAALAVCSAARVANAAVARTLTLIVSPESIRGEVVPDRAPQFYAVGATRPAQGGPPGRGSALSAAVDPLVSFKMSASAKFQLIPEETAGSDQIHCSCARGFRADQESLFPSTT